ncbi:Hypothetical_protein [Hexamita inflata]|uniref:Hypothetical_protein n=1 Tax=Hexamita inflata TaxID=28002 RepID=A0ABP1JFW7_9EUKA
MVPTKTIPTKPPKNMISYELGIRKNECRLSASILSRIDFIWPEPNTFQDFIVPHFEYFELLFIWTSFFSLTVQISQIIWRSDGLLVSTSMLEDFTRRSVFLLS